MYKFNLNKQNIFKYFTSYRFDINKLSSLKKWKIGYFFIVSSVILLIFGAYIVNKQIKSNKTKKKINIVKNSEFIAVKKFLLNKIKSPFINVHYQVKSGDTLKKILKKNEINDKDIQKTIVEFKKLAKSSNIISGNWIDIVLKKEASLKKNSLHKILIPISKSSSVEILKNEQGELFAEKIITKLFKKLKLAENNIDKSLYASAIKAKIKPDVIVEFARIFGFEIDFQRDIRKNDTFQILYESFYDDSDEFVKSGPILYAYMSVNNREIALYKFGNDKDYGYFDINGKSVEKALMKTPINGARLSSPFGMRKHPILGFNKKHTGTDFAAPEGTPIMASGSGTVVFAKWCGGGGNCIKIKHNSTYSTVYGHMKSFTKGIRKGTKVKQGRIIGYVGSTGMSTGPHLHYVVIVNGKKVDSQKLKLPSGKILKKEERKKFEVHRIKTDVLIAELIDKKN